MVAKVLRLVAGWGMVAVGVFFGLFAAGYAFEDPGGWAAVGLVAAWLVPAVALALLAWRRPDTSVLVLGAVVLLVAAVTLVQEVATGWLGEWIDATGPIAAISVGVVAVPAAVLGLRRPWAGGLLLVALGAAVLAALLAAQAVRGGDGGGLGGLLGGSSGVLIVPVVVSGALLLLSDQLDRHAPTTRATHRPAHA